MAVNKIFFSSAFFFLFTNIYAQEYSYSTIESNSIVLLNQTDRKLFVFHPPLNCSGLNPMCSETPWVLPSFQSTQISFHNSIKGDFAKTGFSSVNQEVFATACYDAHKETEKFNIEALFNNYPGKSFEISITSKNYYGLNFYYCSAKEINDELFGELEHYKDGKEYPMQVKLNEISYNINYAGLIKGLKEISQKISKLLFDKKIIFTCGVADDYILFHYTILKNLIPQGEISSIYTPKKPVKNQRFIIRHSGPEELSHDGWVQLIHLALQQIAREGKLSEVLYPQSNKMSNDKIIQMIWRESKPIFSQMMSDKKTDSSSDK
ncbi:MAG: hypothetical protein K2X39_04135 [Silvanigrellaceae bacterium]|nr:hypothetical protein [Silvanigrellaceae bacterium]